MSKMLQIEKVVVSQSVQRQSVRVERATVRECLSEIVELSDDLSEAVSALKSVQ